MEFLALSGWPPVASLFAHAAAAGCALMEMHGCTLECACQYSIALGRYLYVVGRMAVMKESVRGETAVLFKYVCICLPSKKGSTAAR